MSEERKLPLYRIRSQNRFDTVTIECLEDQTYFTLSAIDLVLQQDIINGLLPNEAMIVGYIAGAANELKSINAILM